MDSDLEDRGPWVDLDETEEMPTGSGGSRAASTSGSLAHSRASSPPATSAAPADNAAAPSGDDENVCRVCRAEDEPGNPLYHPCKCSGSIRYVHSDCLVQWLQQSKNKKCELCGYPFSFRKIYPADMPSRLPAPALLRTLAADLAWLTLTTVRAVVVAIAWLVFLPLAAYGMWLTLFAGGSSFAWWLMDPQKGIVAVVSNGAASKGGAGRAIKLGLEMMAESGNAIANSSASDNATLAANASETLAANATTSLNNTTATGHGRLIRAFVKGLLFPFSTPAPWPQEDEWPAFWHSAPETIFRGQILTVCVVLGFLAVFLLREWIFQNGLGPDGAQAPGGNRVEVPVDGPQPRPEEFAPDVMAVRWRRRRAEGRDRERDGGVRDAHGRRRRARRRQPGAPVAGVAGAGQERPALLAAPALPFLNDREAGLARPADEPFDEHADHDHADHQDEYESVEGSPSVEARQLGDTEPTEAPAAGTVDGGDDDDAAIFADELDPVAMREARNRYFAIRDHNHDFGTQAELNASGNAEAGPSKPVAATPRIVEPEEAKDTTAGPSAAPRRSARLKAKMEDADREKPLEDVPRDVQDGPDDGWEDMPELTSASGAAPTQQANAEPPRLLAQPIGVDQLQQQLDALQDLLQNRPQPAGVIMPIAGNPGVPIAEQQQRRVGMAAAFANLDELDRRVAELNADDRDDFDDFDDAEDGEGGFLLEGDLDGVMEAIGMRGPIFNLAQNVFIILFILGVCLTVLVQVPYVIGKMHLLADLDFLVNIVTLPVRLVRFVSDPVIDIVLDFARLLVIQPLRTRIPVIDSYLGKMSAASASTVKPGKYSSIFGKMLNNGSQSSIQSLRGIPYQIVGSLIPELPPLKEDATMARKALYLVVDGFAALGAFTVDNWERQEKWLDALTVVDTTFHRIVIIGIGYFDVCGLLFLLATLGEERLGATGKVIAQSVHQYATVVKLGFFMAIELFVFPLIMGYFLDLFSLPLFVDGTLAGRIQAQQSYPILSTFGHWLGGTLFMFSFAKFLSTCRSICRKGAMYIIRDPQDPSFSPVRDILDKKTSVQLYKLIVSACMYLSVLSGPIGGLLFAIRYGSAFGPVLPLRLHMKSPASTNPVDIVLLLFVVRQALAYAFPTDHLRRALKMWWKLLARTLRLTSYFDGVRHPEEEEPGRVERALLSIVAPVHAVFRTLTLRPKRAVEKGGFMRVPYADQVVLIRPRKAVFIAVDSSGVPVDEDGKITAIQQTRVATKAGRNPRQDYCMVHLPPFYRARFWIFAITLWTGVAWASAGSMLGVLVLGRWIAGLYYQGPVHDGYSLIIGAHAASVVWYLTIEVAYRQYRHRRRGIASTRTTRTRLLGAWLRARRAPSLVALAASLPVGIMFELYVAFPLKYGFSTMTPVLHLQEAWVTGIGIVALCIYRRNFRAIVSVLLIDVKLPKLGGRLTILDKTVPVVISLVAPIVSPSVIAFLICTVGRLSEAQSAIIYRWIYPALLMAQIGARAMRQTNKGFQEWSTRKLESRYLVEQRVMNLEESEGLGQDVKVLDPTRHAAEGGLGAVRELD